MRKLASKLLVVQIAFLVVALTSIGLTLFVSWKLEGSAAAINDAGSLRMRAWRLAYLASHAGPGDPLLAADVGANLHEFDQVFATLRAGDPARPLLLPANAAIHGQLAELDRHWKMLAPALAEASAGGAPPARADVERFVGLVNVLVTTVEQDVAAATALLRTAQFALVALAIAGTVALMYLSFLFVIRPVTRLQEGIERMTAGDFAVRVPVETRDEFGLLTRGFNHMAERLEGVYLTLEHRVAEKTRTLAERNARLGTLYDMTAFLNEPQALEEMCRGFASRLRAAFGAEAAAMRLTGPDGSLHLYVTDNVPADFAARERCMRPGECACGDAAGRAAPVVHLLDRPSISLTLPHCREAGFGAVAAVPVEAQGEVLGVFNLFFGSLRIVGADERHLLATLGQHLGVAVQNLRLASREKEMAISEERNLLAQELHDSIAQSLAFLNLQVQMLATAMHSHDHGAASETLGEIREGVQECYADVRELLTYFRTRVAPADLEHAIGSLLAKFERQTGIKTALTTHGSAMALAPERQLQVLHIVQEALSNARKHAGCNRVEVTLERDADYRVCVRDDGRGFDPEAARMLEDHVGLRIMHERAARAGGAVQVHSRTGTGTEVRVTLPAAERAAA